MSGSGLTPRGPSEAPSSRNAGPVQTHLGFQEAADNVFHDNLVSLPDLSTFVSSLAPDLPGHNISAVFESLMPVLQEPLVDISRRHIEAAYNKWQSNGNAVPLVRAIDEAVSSNFPR